MEKTGHVTAKIVEKGVTKGLQVTMTGREFELPFKMIGGRLVGFLDISGQVSLIEAAAEELMRGSEHRFDLLFIDLPGTMESRGVLSAVLNMDYVLTPIIADRMVMQSSLSFSSAVLDYIRDRKDIPLKGIYFFWNRVDRRTSTGVFDAYRTIMQRLELNVLDTIIPETRRYDKELALAGRSYFRCTLLPPPLKLLKGSGLEELATELAGILNLNIG